MRQIGPHGAHDAVFFSVSIAMILWVLHYWDAHIMRLRAVRALAWVGTFSYSLYLVGYAGAGLGDLILGPFALSGFGYAAHFALRTLGALLVGWVFYRLCENPILCRQRARRPQQLQLA
jgi:peptidoglycan/LPS O-acetylase OafA/YrhL